jgi:hypothetical protein
MAYKMTLLSTKVHTLWVVNKALSKHYRAKKACVCQEGALTVENTQDIIAQKDINKQVQHNVYTVEGSYRERQLSGQYYRIYRKAGYNTQTC